jgi:hypothetical protein
VDAPLCQKACRFCHRVFRHLCGVRSRAAYCSPICRRAGRHRSIIATRQRHRPSPEGASIIAITNGVARTAPGYPDFARFCFAQRAFCAALIRALASADIVRFFLAPRERWAGGSPAELARASGALLRVGLAPSLLVACPSVAGNAARISCEAARHELPVRHRG